MYLSQYLARCGVDSRRKVVEIIKEGRVLVNGQVVADPAYVVDEKDRVLCDDRLVRPQEPVCILLNKPKGVVTTCKDQKKRVSVVDLVKYKGMRLYPVGRLDMDTTGLVLLTNDGDFAQRLAHPKYEVRKVYIAALDKPMEHDQYEALKKGFYLYDGRFLPDRVFYPTKGNKYIIGLEIHSGKYRIIRRALFKLGFEVTSLDRIAYGSLTLKGVKRGEWKLLKKAEIAAL